MLKFPAKPTSAFLAGNGSSFITVNYIRPPDTIFNSAWFNFIFLLAVCSLLRFVNQQVK